jgi:hypothetical protein
LFYGIRQSAFVFTERQKLRPKLSS